LEYLKGPINPEVLVGNFMDQITYKAIKTYKLVVTNDTSCKNNLLQIINKLQSWNVSRPVSNVKRKSDSGNHTRNIGFQACSNSGGERRNDGGGGRFNLGRGGQGFGRSGQGFGRGHNSRNRTRNYGYNQGGRGNHDQYFVLTDVLNNLSSLHRRFILTGVINNVINRANMPIELFQHVKQMIQILS
jgi:hypothetical protein